MINLGNAIDRAELKHLQGLRYDLVNGRQPNQNDVVREMLIKAVNDAIQKKVTG